MVRKSKGFCVCCGLTWRYECADADMKQEGGEEIVTPVTAPAETGSGPENPDQVRSLEEINHLFSPRTSVASICKLGASLGVCAQVRPLLKLEQACVQSRGQENVTHKRCYLPD